MKKMRKYIITFGVGLIFVFLIALLKDIFQQDNAKSVFHILTDAFFAIGILMFCFGILVFSSNSGTFDMLHYGVVKLIDLIRNNISNAKYKTFYDFKVDKHETNTPFLFLVIVGTIFVIISLIFLRFYNQC